MTEEELSQTVAYFEARRTFSADQVREIVAAEVAKERERCARIVESQDTYGDPVGCWLETLAAKIRSQHD